MRIPVSISTKSVALFLFLAHCPSPEGWNIRPYGRLNDPELVESSGLTASRNHPRVFWTHNDDGSPTLFAVDRRGKMVQSYVLPGARNRDWESIALDDEGFLYILDNPADLALVPLAEVRPRNFGEWFAPGLVYLMINPDGTRPLVFGPDDRCIVVGESPEGELFAQARRLEPATVIESIENLPPWLIAQREGSRLLLTLGPDAPGLGKLGPGRQVGFNMMYVGGRRELVSWTPLTQRFSWDSPSFWGLLEME